MIIKVLVKEGRKAPESKGDTLLVYTNAKRENNQANYDIIGQLSKYYRVSISDIRLIKGRTSRNKTFEIKEKQ